MKPDGNKIVLNDLHPTNPDVYPTNKRIKNIYEGLVLKSIEKIKTDSYIYLQIRVSGSNKSHKKGLKIKQ